MKTLITYTLTIISLSLFSQNLSKDIKIEIGCSIVGNTSEEIFEYKNLLKASDYPTVKSNLFSSSLIDQFLSTIVLTELLKKKMVSLTENEVSKMELVKKSNTLCIYCFGCDGRGTKKFVDIFYPKHKRKNNTVKVYETIAGYLGI